MKPVATFALGAVLAVAATYFVLRPKAPEPVATSPLAAPVPTHAAPIAETPMVSDPPQERPAPITRTRPRATSSTRQDTAPTPSPKAEERKPELVAAAPAPVASAAPPSPVPVVPVEEKKPEPRKANTVTVPSGSLITVRLDEKLSSATHQEGDSFRATLDQALVVDGFVIAERGARVEGRVAESGAGGRVKGKAGLTVELVRLTTADGQKLRLKTDSFAKQATGSLGKDAAKVGVAAGIGAAIGAIAGGGKGAAIGAGVGGAAGTGGVMATRGGPAELPNETRLSFRLSDAISVTERLK